MPLNLSITTPIKLQYSSYQIMTKFVSFSLPKTYLSTTDCAFSKGYYTVEVGDHSTPSAGFNGWYPDIHAENWG